MGETPENQKYSEEEALAEAELLRDIKEAGEGKRSYSDAERWMKISGQEVRPFDEKRFAAIEEVLDGLLVTNLKFQDPLLFSEYVQESIPRILDSKDLFLRAYDYKNDRLVSDIEEIIRSNADGGDSEENKYAAVYLFSSDAVYTLCI